MTNSNLSSFVKDNLSTIVAQLPAPVSQEQLLKQSQESIKRLNSAFLFKMRLAAHS